MRHDGNYTYRARQWAHLSSNLSFAHLEVIPHHKHHLVSSRDLRHDAVHSLHICEEGKEIASGVCLMEMGMEGVMREMTLLGNRDSGTLG